MSLLLITLGFSWKTRASGLFLQCRRVCTHAHLFCVSRRECTRAGILVNFEATDLIIFWNVLICQMLMIVKQHILRRVVIKTQPLLEPSRSLIMFKRMAEVFQVEKVLPCTNDSGKFSEPL